ncbi:hypothetical protein BH23BAC4_BH23BAC4_07850 [soil metagenome]
MATDTAGRKAAYEQARAAFEDLGTEDKTAFAVEAAFNAFGTAVKDAGRALADVIERVQKEDFWKAPVDDQPAESEETPSDATTAP